MGEAPDSHEGRMFGPYRLKRPLGRGGMGEVYEAEHTVKGWTVAVKLMSENVSKDPVFRERMKREARIAGRLQEPHVVPIHDYGEIDGLMYLEMRLIEGTDLDKLIAQHGRLPPSRAVAIITQIASALDAAHAAGVMHRDVKPPNILVTRDDFAYLVDFGIASATTDEKLTQLGTAVGTWKYMAPERFSNDEVTYRADIYALACVLYECLTGGAPYQSDSAGVLISAHMNNPIPRPSAAVPGVPRALDTVIARGMAKNPADRYASAGELARAAQQALSEPDRDQVADIVRRSQEAVLPAPPVVPQTIRYGPAPAPRPVGHPAPPSGPLPRRTAAPAGPPGYPGGPVFPPGPPPQPFAGPMPWHPAPPRRRNPWAIVAGVAAVFLVLILAAIGVHAATKDDDAAQSGRTTTVTTPPTTTWTTWTTSTTTTTTAASGAETQLMRLLPAGYPPGTCKTANKPMPGALVSVTCGQNTDANGPRLSTYGLYADVAALKDAFKGFIGTFTIQTCPGGRASPGTWWHTQDPQAILGQVACGVYQGTDPQVMWSNENTLVFALVAGNPQGPTLDQLYDWWASHS
ncbi:serine/threonine-protein kinase [Mycobacterium asiaticum]|uniref:non-specific serine/threonine protein kinase n=1 Tax=Mycobacterium asiaticum TaxID=1790 RepID=A0A1A3NI22_MYCAS|nr:serine/threonine-protein kinase [Mycobacterium asiaticum]OBK20042.1 protein kinase [Mycobacterium asiaticum]